MKRRLVVYINFYCEINKKDHCLFKKNILQDEGCLVCEIMIPENKSSLFELRLKFRHCSTVKLSTLMRRFSDKNRVVIVSKI